MKHTLLASTFLATLVFTPAAAAQETAATPRDLLERAHYAENHEHDLAAAVDGYRAAAEAARAAGDTNVANEADAALARVEVRLGTRPATTTDLPKDLLDLFMRAQSLEVGHSEIATVARDMALYGDTAVQVLREWITSPRGALTKLHPNTPLRANPFFAAAALGELDSAAAREALLLAMDSSDPLLRRAALQSAAVDFGALFARGIDDPVDALRDLATNRLLQSKDPTTVAAFETLARRNVPGALDTLAELDPLRALAVLEEPWATREHADAVSRGISQHAGRPMTRDTVIGVVRLGWESKSTLVQATARAALSPIRRDSNYASLPSDIETMRVPAIREALDQAPPEMRMMFAHLLDDAAALDAVLAFLGSANGPLDEGVTRTVQYQLRQCIERASNRSELAEKFFDLSLRSTDWNALDAAVAKGDRNPESAALTAFAYATLTSNATLDDAPRIARMFTKIPAPQRHYVCRDVANWLLAAIEPKDLAGFGPGRLPVAFGDVGVVLLESDGAAFGRAALYCLRGSGDPRLLESAAGASFSMSAFPNRELQVVLTDAAAAQPQKLSDLLFARIAPHVHAATLPFEANYALDTAIGQTLPFATAFIARLFATNPTQELRHRALGNYCNFQRGDETLAKLHELYPTLTPIDPSSDVRPMLLRRFGNTLYEPALELLGASLRDRDANVREAAQAAFEAFRKHREALEEYEAWRHASDDARETVAELVKLLASDNKDVVRGAVEALGAVKARTALPQLVVLLGRDDAELKAAVNKAIAAIGG
jgi:HEAT repeat protein